MKTGYRFQKIFIETFLQYTICHGEFDYQNFANSEKV